jgi:NIMA (never in mitosis gene a)-related kinase
MNTLKVSVVEELGRGTSGVVYKVQHQLSGRYFVVKTIDFSNISEQKQDQALKEVDLLKKVSHPHIIKYFDSLIQNRMLFILMEYAAGGDLQQKLNRYKVSRRHIEEGQIWLWAYEIALGLKHLHKRKILHRDIKCMNIFLDKNNRVKIGDLGLSKILNDKETNTSTIGTPLYLSPEQIRHQPYGFKVDVWGMGCVLYALCTFEAPFLGDSLLTLGQNIALKEPKALPPKYSPRLVAFVSKLLEKNHKNRPRIRDVLELVPVFTKKTYRVPASDAEVGKIEKMERLQRSEKKEKSEKKEREEREENSKESRDHRDRRKIRTFEVQEKAESVLERMENDPNDNFFVKCFSTGVGKDGILRRLTLDCRPATQATGRVVVASSDSARVSSAYAKHRYMRSEKPRTTIGDLFGIS